MNDYARPVTPYENQRVEKAATAFNMWADGDGDMGELAVSLYDLLADYRALLEDLEAYREHIAHLEAYITGDWDCPAEGDDEENELLAALAQEEP